MSVIVFFLIVRRHPTTSPPFFGGGGEGVKKRGGGFGGVFLGWGVGGTKTGRFSCLGWGPYMEVLASENEVTVLDHLRGTRAKTTERDPITVAGAITEQWNPCKPPGLPDCFAGGWVGYVGYDTVRYQYTTKLPFSGAPPDDRGVPDLCLGLYRDVMVFDHATKQVRPCAFPKSRHCLMPRMECSDASLTTTKTHLDCLFTVHIAYHETQD